MSLSRTDANAIWCGALSAAIALGLALGFADAARADSFERASRYVDKGKYSAATPHLRRGARKGDMRCQFLLGMWSISGTGMEQDLDDGAAWLHKAADQGLPIAQAYLGLLYTNGVGVEPSEERAAEWFHKASIYGEPMGQAALGIATFLGSGIPEDRVEAYKWTSLAAEQGNERAAEYLPIIEQELTEGEIAEARNRAEAFVPKTPPGILLWRPDVKLFDASTYLRHSTSGAAR